MARCYTGISCIQPVLGGTILAPTWEVLSVRMVLFKVKDNPKLRQPTFLDLYNFKQGKKPKNNA
jgi:hypothetical protein